MCLMRRSVKNPDKAGETARPLTLWTVLKGRRLPLIPRFSVHDVALYIITGIDA
jgi:hypothetical protein